MTTARHRNPSTSDPEPFHHLFKESSSWAVSSCAYLSTDIKAGKVGRMRYLATDWNAKAADNSSIPAGTDVIPIARQGNTWLVMAATDNQVQLSA
ncbi:MAG: NfeD family protein [Cyanobacteria bacterium P01_D01_bin.56]